MRDRCDVAEAMLLDGLDLERREEFHKRLNEPLVASKPQDRLRRLLGV